MKLSEFAKSILENGDIESKLVSTDSIEFDDWKPYTLEAPVRDEKIGFSHEQLRFPRGHFHEIKKRAMALNAFANHELLAVEIMAYALLLFKHDTPEEIRFKKGILSSLKDEQKHFCLYRKRLNDFGYEFGDFPLNDFFWDHMKKMKTPSEYLSMMALTFEAANLDFAYHYEKVFRDLGDIETADVLKIVYEDEISHVAFGVNYLNKFKEDKRLWDYYLSVLPEPLTPARSKGKIFHRESRKRARLDDDFLKELESFKNDFSILERKSWK